ncbi:hypothetical protein [Peptacetobacter sp. AB800]|uniref:hypothetical protein n=1 Tax=Peptacetobacter sp. AB800 TaxID=3388428 RepID=UPI0039FD8BA3
MRNDIFYTLIETVVANKLKDMKKYPKRATRNLIDLGLLFSKGKFQNAFFSSAQTMLQNEDSPYYKLIDNVVNGVENQRLLTFGMNLGYNSFKSGSREIRRNERKLNCTIPWEITLHIDNFSFKNNNQSYDRLISDGERLGIYSWIIFLDKPFSDFLDLVKKHPDSVFFIFLEDLDEDEKTKQSKIDENFLDYIEELKNIMLIIELDKKNRHVYNDLKQKKLLYSVYYRYSQKNIDLILDGSILRFAEQFNPFFTVFVSEPYCNKNLRKMVYNISEQSRNEQLYSTISWELFHSNAYIDKVISGKSRYISFDYSGILCDVDGKKIGDKNIFESDLVSILN